MPQFSDLVRQWVRPDSRLEISTEAAGTEFQRGGQCAQSTESEAGKFISRRCDRLPAKVQNLVTQSRQDGLYTKENFCHCRYRVTKGRGSPSLDGETLVSSAEL